MRTLGFVFAALAAVVGLVYPTPAASAPLATQVFSRMGNGSAVECNTTPATVADVTFTPTGNHWLIISNPSSGGVVYIGGTGVGANGVIVRPGDTLILPVTRTAAVRCYAASATTINVVGAE